MAIISPRMQTASFISALPHNNDGVRDVSLVAKCLTHDSQK